MTINWYRQLYRSMKTIRLKALMEEHKEDEQVIMQETWDKYLPGKKPTLRVLLNQLGDLTCEYLGERSPYFRDEGYLDFVAWPPDETKRKNKRRGLHFCIGVRSST